jgi:hypothetical protein
MKDAHLRNFDVAICWKFDRFARSVSHLLRALETFRSLGVEFVSLTEQVDTTTPMGKMIFTILGSVAELERNLIVERVRAGMRNAKAKGSHIGRPPLRQFSNAEREEVRAAHKKERTSIRQLAMRWVREIEEADGTLHFRWLLLIPRQHTGPDTQAYFAVGGLSSGDSRFWVRRWTVITGNPQSRCFARYRLIRPYGAKVSQIFEELLDGKRIGTDFLLRIQLGPEHIQKRRSFKTDEHGMPRDKGRLKLLALDRYQLRLENAGGTLNVARTCKSNAGGNVSNKSLDSRTGISSGSWSCRLKRR